MEKKKKKKKKEEETELIKIFVVSSIFQRIVRNVEIHYYTPVTMSVVFVTL